MVGPTLKSQPRTIGNFPPLKLHTLGTKNALKLVKRVFAKFVDRKAVEIEFREYGSQDFLSKSVAIKTAVI